MMESVETVDVGDDKEKGDFGRVREIAACFKNVFN